MKVYTDHPFVAGAPVTEKQLGGAMRDISEALSNIEWRLIEEDGVGMADIGYLSEDGFVGATADQDSFKSGTGWWIFSEVNGESYQADCELAWTSFDKAVRKFSWRWWAYYSKI